MPLPDTHYILTAYKEYIIQNIDPKEVSPYDVNRGLKYKEHLIAMYTHELLDENIDNYKELEEQVANYKEPGSEEDPATPEKHPLIKLLRGELEPPPEPTF